MEPVQEEIVGSAEPRHLGAAGGRRIRAADRVREPREPAARARGDAPSRVCGAHGARRRTRPAAAASS